MKKVCLLLLVAAMIFSMAACGTTKVLLHCDGQNCENMVKFKIEKGITVDESWVALCKTCASYVMVD